MAVDMNINKEYLRLLKESNLSTNPLEQSQGIFFGFLIENMYEFPELEQVLFNSGIFPYERFQEYQIQLCRTNELGNLELIVPLTGFDVGDEYYELCNLLSTMYVGSQGHINSKLEYSIYDDYNDKEALKKAKEILGTEFHLGRAAIVIANYYETTQYAKKFAGYVGSNNFIQDFKQFVQ